MFSVVAKPVYVSSQYIFVNPLSDDLQIFSPTFSLLFCFVDDFLAAEALQYDIVPLVHFHFAAFGFGVKSKKIIAKTNVKELTPMFSFRILWIQVLNLSLTHFELIFVCCVRQGSIFILSHVNVQFSQHHLFIEQKVSTSLQEVILLQKDVRKISTEKWLLCWAIRRYY